MQPPYIAALAAALSLAAASAAQAQSTASEIGNPNSPGPLVCRVDAAGRPVGCAVSAQPDARSGPAAARGPQLDAPATLSRTADMRPVQPRFAAAPSAEQVRAALEPVAEASPGGAARAAFRCQVAAGGALTGCRAVSGDPAAQAAAAPLLAAFIARPTAPDRVTVALSYVAE